MIATELTEPVRSRRATALGVVVPAVVYLALACAVYWPVAPFDPNHVVGDCACSDAIQQAWFLKWVAFALSHGNNPLFSTYLNAPAGANLAVNTSMPLLGLLGWPVTALSNPVAAFNFLLRLSLGLSALSMYLVLRRYVRSSAAAFVGGLFFGFSPYMLAEGQLHVFLVFLPLLPPLIPLIDRWLVRADRSPYRCGALIGLLLGLEMWISAELVVVFLIFAVIALLPLALLHRDLVRSRWPLLGRGLVAAAAVGLLVGGYVVWMLVAGPQRPVGPPHSVSDLDSYHADLLSLFVPSRPQLLRPPLLRGVADQFVKGVVHENGFYLGIPLLVLLIVAAVRLRRQALVVSFATLGVISFVLGLGVHLTVANHKLPILLPFAPITRIPLLQEIGPTRFALSIDLAASVLLAVALDHLLQRPGLVGMRRPVTLVGLTLVVLVPLLPSGFLPSVGVGVPSYFTSGAAAQIPDGSVVLPYPYPFYTANGAMLWQAVSDMRFRIEGGEVYAPKPKGHGFNYPRGDLSPQLWSVFVKHGFQAPKQQIPLHWNTPSAAQRAGLVSDLRSYVASHPVDAVAVFAGGAQGRWVAALTASAFGAPTSVHGTVSVWVRPVP